MSNGKWIGASVATLGAIFAAGCASSVHREPGAAFPTGTYQNGETIAIFDVDGTFKGTTTQYADWVKGTYSVSGKTLTMVDGWESDSLVKQMGRSCTGIAGKYRWTMADGVLTATALDDPCEGRRQGTSGVPWKFVR